MKKSRNNSKEVKIQIDKKAFLNILKLGTVLAVAFIAPNAIKVLKDFVKEEDEWSDYYPSSLEKMTSRLLRRGQVEVIYKKDQPVVKITDKGITETLKYDLENFEIKKPKKWDKKWRLVIFDLPVEYRQEREILRDKLKQAGFYQMQKSVYLYPFPCEKEIKYLREVLEIPHYVKFAVIKKMENDEDLRKIFQI